MAGYIKKPHTTIFTGQIGCGKTHLVLDLIEKEYNKNFDYIINIYPTLRWNKTYHSEDSIKNDDKVWFIKPKDKLYQWIEKLSRLLAHWETAFIIDDIIADWLSQVDIGTIIYNCWHSLILPYQKVSEGRPRPYLFGIQKTGTILKWYIVKTMCWWMMN